MPRLSELRLLPRLAVVLLGLLTLSGCGYMVGQGFPAEVRTVHVPTFTNATYRRDIEFMLTEAVHKQIQQRTPYRLVKDGIADTRLTGRIVDIRKDVLGETRFDDPRELQLTLAIEVRWEDLRTGRILAEERISVDPDVVQLEARAEFAPEVGQSLATGTQQSVERMARQIVNMMENPW